MTRPLVGILDCTTNETIVREMNDEEYAQYEIERVAAEAALEAEPTND
jgi:hypothetical protein